METRVGQGYDIHPLSAGRKLILGGVEIVFEVGCLGHSDGDALCHAIADAILGASCSGDIGKHFPDTDETIRGISSIIILANIMDEARKKMWKIGNVDATVILERPKLQDYILKMREKIAGALRVHPDVVSVKAKTAEGFGAVGEGLAVETHAVVALVR